MKVNESNADRIIRAVLGVVLLFLGFGGSAYRLLGYRCRCAGRDHAAHRGHRLLPALRRVQIQHQEIVNTKRRQGMVSTPCPFRFYGHQHI